MRLTDKSVQKKTTSQHLDKIEIIWKIKKKLMKKLIKFSKKNSKIQKYKKIYVDQTISKLFWNNLKFILKIVKNLLKLKFKLFKN